MKHEQYTSDAICQSMGLEAFIEDSWAASDQSVVRLLLKPSFEPEVCVTLVRSSDAATLSVVVLSEMLYRQLEPCRVLEHRAESIIPKPQFDKVETRFTEAYANYESRGRIVGCDGMSLDCCLVSDGTFRRFGEIVSQTPVVRLVSDILAMAWESFDQLAIKNGLAKCAKYIGVDYPIQKEQETPDFTRVLVLGDPEERREFFELLRKRFEGQQRGMT